MKRQYFYVLFIIGIFIGISFIYSNVNGKQSPGVSKNQSANIPKEVVSKDGTLMVLIPAGEFQMGSNNGADDEKPVHTVYLDAFYMDKYEVTNALYKRFVKETGRKDPEGRGFKNREFRDDFRPWSEKNFNDDNQPVVCVTWEDAKAYAEWAGKRLPTEAEWEKAARGGLAGKEYPWGDDWPPPKGAGNLSDVSGTIISPKWHYISGYNDGFAYPSPKGSFKPNSYGLCDMVGNVSEWCSDWWDMEYYVKSPRQNPIGPETGETRILRGSNWYDFDPYRIRVAKRITYVPRATNDYTGFRCALSVPQ